MQPPQLPRLSGAVTLARVGPLAVRIIAIWAQVASATGTVQLGSCDGVWAARAGLPAQSHSLSLSWAAQRVVQLNCGSFIAADCSSTLPH